MTEHGPDCSYEFIASDVLKLDGGKPHVVKEGTFQGTCSREPNVKGNFAAVRVEKIVVEQIGLDGGPGKPATLDRKSPDAYVVVTARPWGRCDRVLSTGMDAHTTWALGAGCDAIIKLEDAHGSDATLRPVGPGTCTVTATVLGMSGTISVVVK
jgi:hypothetical protein